MGTSLAEISSFLENLGFRYGVDDEQNHIVTAFSTEEYTDYEGDYHLQIVIQLREKGEFVQVFTPRCYCYSDGPHKQIVFQVLLMICWRTKMVQFEYDQSDGEIRAIIEFPLEDSILTEKQLNRCMQALVGVIDKYHSSIQTAIDKGEIDTDSLLPSDDLVGLFEPFLPERDTPSTQGGAAVEPKSEEASEPDDATTDNDDDWIL